MSTERSDSEILASSASSGYVGGGYYNPIDEFVKIARPLASDHLTGLLQDTNISQDDADRQTFVISRILGELLSLVAPDELVFAAYDKGRYTLAVYIVNEERLMDFEIQVSSGALKRVGFFGLARDRATEGLVREFVPPDTKPTGSTERNDAPNFR